MSKTTINLVKLILLMLISIVFNNVQSQTLNNSKWLGTLIANKTKKIQVAFELDENLNGKFHSVDEKTFDIEISNFNVEKSKISFELKSKNAIFNGHVDDTLINGTFEIGKKTYNIKLNKCSQFSFVKLNSVTDKQIPGNYISEILTIPSLKSNILLEGTLTIPKDIKNFPTVILISSLGPNDPNNSIFGEKNFLKLTDLFLKSGIATFRIDNRYVKNTKVDFSTASVYELSDDISQAVNYLKRDKRINATKIGLFGQSYGAEIAPMISVVNPNVQYVIMMNASADPLYRRLIEQTEEIYAKKNISKSARLVNSEILIYFFESLLKYDSNEKAKHYFDKRVSTIYPKLKNISKSELESMGLKANVSSADFEDFYSSKWRTDLFYDPSHWISKLKVPVLAFSGIDDIEALPHNLELIREILEKTKHKNYQIKLYENRNQRFQNTIKGFQDENSVIEETVSEDMLKDIVEWIKFNNQ